MEVAATLDAEVVSAVEGVLAARSLLYGVDVRGTLTLGTFAQLILKTQARGGLRTISR